MSSWRNWLARTTVNREVVSSILTEDAFLPKFAASTLTHLLPLALFVKYNIIGCIIRLFAL